MESDWLIIGDLVNLPTNIIVMQCDGNGSGQSPTLQEELTLL
jgi:hypothetical protein